MLPFGNSPKNIIKYIPLQQGLRLNLFIKFIERRNIIKYIPLQQGLRLYFLQISKAVFNIIKYIPLQQGLRPKLKSLACLRSKLLSIFHYNKD